MSVGGRREATLVTEIKPCTSLFFTTGRFVHGLISVTQSACCAGRPTDLAFKPLCLCASVAKRLRVLDDLRVSAQNITPARTPPVRGAPFSPMNPEGARPG